MSEHKHHHEQHHHITPAQEKEAMSKWTIKDWLIVLLITVVSTGIVIAGSIYLFTRPVPEYPDPPAPLETSQEYYHP